MFAADPRESSESGLTKRPSVHVNAASMRLINFSLFSYFFTIGVMVCRFLTYTSEALSIPLSQEKNIYGKRNRTRQGCGKL
jgi:hypothetical protein